MRPFRWGNSNTNRDVGGGGCGGDRVGIHYRSKPAAGRDIVGLIGTEHIETGNICSPRGRRNVSPDAEAPAPPCGLLVPVEDEGDGGDTARWLNHNAVECQRVG